ncbi:MAG TPA: prolyl oligopeptidase family serine peptidase [Microthrixaceae bacterium]|nr:prolyl oligopeptidase family serine peptidase [Microthrixaceae bacterium]
MPNQPAESVAPVVVKDNSIQAGLIRREYLTVVPEDLRTGEKLPVVLVLHGLGVDRNRMLNSADWRGAVGRDRFVAVFPQGFGNSWNLGPCCPPASLLGLDDMSFIDQVMNRVNSAFEVDPDRTFITGFSAGGLMTYAVVCARPGVYAAMAPMGGSNVLRCKPTKPISLLHQHSDPDPVVPFNGGFGVGQIVSSAPLPSVPETVAEWAAADGCDPNSTVSNGPSGVERFKWSGCSGGTSVELVRLPGRGHEWPRLGNYDGLREALKFFGLE